MNFEPGPDGVVRISFEIADLKTWVQIPVGALKILFNAYLRVNLLLAVHFHFHMYLAVDYILERKGGS